MFYALLIFLTIVGGTYVMYQAFGKSAGAADVQRVKDRLLGKTKSEKSSGGGPAGDTPALIKSDEPPTSPFEKVLKSMQLTERVETMLEQAGLRWTPARLMRTALAGALGGFCLAWYMLPPPFDKFAWATGLIG